MIARHAASCLIPALLGALVWTHSAQAADPAPYWVPLDAQAMPGVFYDSSTVHAVPGQPNVMSVKVAWHYAQARVSEANGKSYGSVVQPVALNCANNTYTVTQVHHYAGGNATGAIVESIPVAGIRDAPIERDPIQRKLRGLVCPATEKKAGK